MAILIFFISIKRALPFASRSTIPDIGVKQAGVKVRACFELDKFACETLRYNIERNGESTKVYEGDVIQVDIEAIKNELERLCNQYTG